MQNVSATDRILGRDSAGAGVMEEITPANLRTMINVEDGATADQTKSDINGLAITTVGTIDKFGKALQLPALILQTMQLLVQRWPLALMLRAT